MSEIKQESPDFESFVDRKTGLMVIVKRCDITGMFIDTRAIFTWQRLGKEINDLRNQALDSNTKATGFGSIPLKQEGAPIHPDGMECELTDGMYFEQLQRYADWHGLEETKRIMTVRHHLLHLLK